MLKIDCLELMYYERVHSLLKIVKNYLSIFLWDINVDKFYTFYFIIGMIYILNVHNIQRTFFILFLK